MASAPKARVTFTTTPTVRVKFPCGDEVTIQQEDEDEVDVCLPNGSWTVKYRDLEVLGGAIADMVAMHKKDRAAAAAKKSKAK
jgi:hypothetical protein